MNQQIQEKTPLQQLVNNSQLEMMEAALPYISPTFQQPLALYIKAQELRNVHEGFQNQDTVSACGLNNSNQGLEHMLRAMRTKANEENRLQIDQLLNLIQLSKMLPILMQNNNNDSNTSSPSNQEALLNQIFDMMKSPH